jgi:predicted DCC family thiol-disulfide oxidoreductase YuxK
MRFENDDERLVAEQAVVNFRELQAVMKTAPHGKGLAVLEKAVRDKGFEQMRNTLGMLIGAHDEAQKKG